MTSSYKYNEPQAAVRDNSMTGASGDGAFIRLLSLFNQNFGMLSGDTDEYVATIENSSMSSFWYDELYADETSSNPCSVFNTSCNNLTAEPDSYDSYSTWQLVVLGSLAGCTSLVTIIGNLIVILSFIIDRTIRQPTNYFIASLAVSDLLIGSISMPFYTVYLLAGESWPLGEFLCDLWLSIDYTVCLCSIYTVFCITIDRFCSVTIPAKYRNWRTEQKVLVMVIVTWIAPSVVFFLSIFGWQYFVGYRSVPSGKCYVQYMEEALFNCLLQVGYFWVTLIVMCTLYTGIYRVALTLQRKSEAKHKKMTTLVSMAGQTMTRIGLGVSTGPAVGTGGSVEPTEATRLTTAAPNKVTGKCSAISEVAIVQPSRTAAVLERSSSPAFASDTDPGSGSATCSRHNGSMKAKLGGRSPAGDEKMDDTGIYMGPAGDDEINAPATIHAKNGCSVPPVSSEEHVKQTTTSPLPETTSSTSQLKLLSNSTSATSKYDVKSSKSDIDVIADGSLDTKSLLKPQKKESSPPASTLLPGSKQQQHHLSLTSIDSMSKGFRSRSRSRNQRDGRDGAGSNSGSRKSSGGRKFKPNGFRFGRYGLGKKSSGRRKDGPQPGAPGVQSGPRGGVVTAQSKSENRARKALRTITVILGAFVLCWTPWHVLSMIIGFCPECVPGVLYNISYWLCYMNSPVNPFCYALANQQFKKTFARILRFDWRRT